MSLYRNYFKRPLDLIISFFAIIFLLPIFLLLGILIKVESKGPIFFTQTRVGKNKKIFKIWKFRSMLTFEESVHPDGSEIPNYDRITKVGSFLRKYSLDELPQLINIFLGDMSIIGPRPTLEYQVKKYNSFQEMRLQVRPGLTGLAQVNGRNNLTWNEKINYDVQYVKTLTFILDIKIFFKTFSVILNSNDNKFTKHDELSKHSGSVQDDIKK